MVESDVDCAGISFIASVDSYTYKSLPQKVMGYHHQWIDCIASIEPACSDSMTSSARKHAVNYHSKWNLVFKETDGERKIDGCKSFDFTVAGESNVSPTQIEWG